MGLGNEGSVVEGCLDMGFRVNSSWKAQKARKTGSEGLGNEGSGIEGCLDMELGFENGFWEWW